MVQKYQQKQLQTIFGNLVRHVRRLKLLDNYSGLNNLIVLQYYKYFVNRILNSKMIIFRFHSVSFVSAVSKVDMALEQNTLHHRIPYILGMAIFTLFVQAKY
jgi:hypothetical protein